MREDLCSIPIHDVFLPREGCPFCRMRDMLEDRLATYVTGAAMMEPDVRVETNRLGFCREHFQQILARGSRLSVALILESLLATVEEEAFPPGKTVPKKAAAAVKARQERCFICNSLEQHTAHLLDSMLKLWQAGEDFRQLYRQQEYICLPHYAMALEAAQKLPRKFQAAFGEDTAQLARRYLETLRGDVTHFCRMFDYRSAGADWGSSRDAIQRAVRYLTGRDPDVQASAQEKNR